MLLLPIHITAGLVALASGAVAMTAPKGGKLHRQSGLVFVYAMLVMSALGAGMAAVNGEQGTVISVIAGLLAFYLVSSAFLTVRLPLERARGWTVGFMLMALLVGGAAVTLGFGARGNVDGKWNGVPATMYFVFGGLTLLAASLDARMLMFGIQGAHRIARHLWRMCLAMFIATASFFLGQAKLFPEPIRKSGLLAIPVLLVIGFLIYWLLRTLWPRRRAAGFRLPTGSDAAR